jgi:tRNA A-37 threonylcarbamoyl transferase component Bud32
MQSPPSPLIEVTAGSGESLPEQIGRYRVVHRVGRGAFAQVYFVRDRETQAPFALKVLRESIDPALAEQVRARFLAEANIAKAIGHPAIVTIHETSAIGECPTFILMDYIEGQSFSDYFQQLTQGPENHGPAPEGPNRLFEVARLGHQVASAMAVAHQKGIVHRDLKPENVLVTWPRGKTTAGVRIVDFGIAKAPLELFSVGSAKTFTRYWTELGTVMGSPPYMAPEQNGAAHTVTGKADVFALGVMLVLTALGWVEPHDGQGVPLAFPADLERVFRERPGLPTPWQSLLRSMVALSPDERPEMHQVARRLQRLAQPNAAFGAAVEAWLDRGKMPRARRLVEFLGAAENAPYLTDDEVLFLKRVPVAKLRSFKLVTSMSIGLAGLCLCSGGLALALAWQSQAFERFRVRSQAEQDEHARQLAALEAKRAEEAAQAALLAAETGSREQRLQALAAALAAERTRAVNQSRARDERTQALRSLNEQLTACTTSTQRAEEEAENLLTRTDAARKELAACRKEADGAAQLASDCQRDLKTKTSQLDESAGRLRLCTQSLAEKPGFLPKTGPPPASPELGSEP